jgi:hypothetical protein
VVCSSPRRAGGEIGMPQCLHAREHANAGSLNSIIVAEQYPHLILTFFINRSTARRARFTAFAA